MQAQLQQEYAQPQKAITLLELVESVFGESITSGLMLCQAWTKTGELIKLEDKVDLLLAKGELTCEQRAAVYYCLSQARWKADDKVGARRAHKLYLSLIQSLESNDEKSIS